MDWPDARPLRRRLGYWTSRLPGRRAGFGLPVSRARLAGSGGLVGRAQWGRAGRDRAADGVLTSLLPSGPQGATPREPLPIPTADAVYLGKLTTSGGDPAYIQAQITSMLSVWSTDLPDHAALLVRVDALQRIMIVQAKSAQSDLDSAEGGSRAAKQQHIAALMAVMGAIRQAREALER